MDSDSESQAELSPSHSGLTAMEQRMSDTSPAEVNQR